MIKIIHVRRTADAKAGVLSMLSASLTHTKMVNLNVLMIARRLLTPFPEALPTKEEACNNKAPSEAVED